MLDVQTMQVLQKVRELQQTCPPDLSLALSELQAAQAEPRATTTRLSLLLGQK